jgi:ABC-type transport system involved in multi-copper enzyme maturation permease subunit
MEGITMMQLIWKEYRQNRLTLLAVGVALLLPYVYMASLGITWSLAGSPRSWIGLIWKASLLSSLIWTVAVAFIGGVIIAGERSDRSAEFLAYLPIDPRRAVAGKAILAFGACLFYFLINVSVFYVTRAGQSYSTPVLNDMIEMIGGPWLVTAVLVFSASWLFSSLLTSPALAAAGGLTVAAISGGAVTGLSGLRIIGSAEALKGLYFWLCLILGVACFAAGIAYFLRRPHPVQPL